MGDPHRTQRSPDRARHPGAAAYEKEEVGEQRIPEVNGKSGYRKTDDRCNPAHPVTVQFLIVANCSCLSNGNNYDRSDKKE